MSLKTQTIVTPRFTLSQARKSLIYVKRVVADICQIHAELVRMRYEIPRLSEIKRIEIDNAYNRMIVTLRELILELHDAGVHIEDFNKGTVEWQGRYRSKNVVFEWSPEQATILPPFREA